MPAILAPHTIGVIGSGVDEHEAYAHAVGVLLGALGVNLLTGGGRGVMTAVSRAYTQQPRTQGISIGIIPCMSETDRVTAKPGYPNPFIELAIYTHLPLSGSQGTHDLSRNHINVLSSTAIIALPGRSGTAAEVALASRYGKPLIAYSPDPALIAHFPRTARRAAAIDDVTAFLRTHIS